MNKKDTTQKLIPKATEFTSSIMDRTIIDDEGTKINTFNENNRIRVCEHCHKLHKMPHSYCCLYECREHEFCRGCGHSGVSKEDSDKQCMNKLLISENR